MNQGEPASSPDSAGRRRLLSPLKRIQRSQTLPSPRRRKLLSTPISRLSLQRNPFRPSKTLQPVLRQLEIPLRPPGNRRVIRRARQTQLRQVNPNGLPICPNPAKIPTFINFSGNPSPHLLTQRLQAQRLPITHHLRLRQRPLRLRRRNPQKQLPVPHLVGLKRRNVSKRISLLGPAGLRKQLNRLTEHRHSSRRIRIQLLSHRFRGWHGRTTRHHHRSQS